MKKALRIFTNKFLISIIVFIVWMMYFDQNDYFTMQQKRKDLKALKDKVAYLNTETKNMQTELADIMTKPQKLEQLARESYYMKRDNEDIYVIEKK